jgi:hypothetical protein
MANALWFGGRAEEAAATRDAALALVTPASGFVTAEVVHIFAAVLSLDLDDVDGFRRCADRFVQHPERVGVHRIVADGYLGYLDVLDGRADRGLAALRTSIDRCGDRNPAPGVRPLLLPPRRRVRCGRRRCDRAGRRRSGPGPGRHPPLGRRGAPAAGALPRHAPIRPRLSGKRFRNGRR